MAGIGTAAVITGLIFLFSGAGKRRKKQPTPTPTPEPTPEPDSWDELDDINEDILVALACAAWAARKPGDTVDSLAVALLRAMFPNMTWPNATNAAQHEALQKTVVFFKSIESGGIVCDAQIIIEDEPREGGYYQIRYGDTPFGIVRDTYPGLSPSQRVAAVKMIRDHPLNAGLRVATTIDANKALVGDTIFSMFPEWKENPTTVSQRFEPGAAYAVLFLPERAP